MRSRPAIQSLAYSECNIEMASYIVKEENTTRRPSISKKKIQPTNFRSVMYWSKNIHGSMATADDVQLPA